MAVLLLPTYALSWIDVRTLRDVGIWAKPMKFMAGTALFALTTVWLTLLVPGKVGQSQSFQWIAALIIVTSLFEVVYITYQAARGEGSHYNTTDPVRAMMFGLMALAAVGLVASQAWLAWVIWKALGTAVLTPTTWAVILGLALTFVLSTVSGFMLGAKQPPAGVGWPVVGWHTWQDLRPAACAFFGGSCAAIHPAGGPVGRTCGWSGRCARCDGFHVQLSGRMGGAECDGHVGLSSMASDCPMGKRLA